jgi:hypothetical protein
MYVNDEILFKILLESLISKYGLMLDSRQCAEALAISTRTLDERRKKSNDCPEYIEAKKGIMFPVQNVVQYQLEKSKQCVKIAN